MGIMPRWQIANLTWKLSYGCDEPIPVPGNRFHKPWAIGIVVQGVAEAFHRAVEAVIEIDKGIGRP